jgi:RNA polymerase sigma factor (sigma-70 family)
MNLHFSYKSAKSPDVEREIQQHVNKLERRLRVFQPDLIHLHGTLDAAPQNGFSLALNLRLPSGQLYAQEKGANGEAAVKASFAELISQLNRHKDLLRNGHKWVRGKRIPEQPEEAGARSDLETSEQAEPRSRKQGGNGHATHEEITAATFVDENRASVQSEVRSYLTANLPRLERFVARELRFRESNGELSPGLVSREEVIDEVVMAALSVDSRPANISLEKWMYRLCIHAIKLLASGNSIDLSNLPLEQSMGTPNVTGSDEGFLQFHQPGETIHREDLIASTAANPEEIAASDELIEQLERALHGTKPDEREAFVLYAIEGFTISEIAEITLRPANVVSANIVAARNHLMKKLPPSNSLKKKLLQYSIVA